ncbi:MAG: hypothetical protein JKY56_01925 [Kofleriaceae bacterium]|nr:hypothetical protein [Kofleriaceae bacterium]
MCKVISNKVSFVMYRMIVAAFLCVPMACGDGGGGSDTDGGGPDANSAGCGLSGSGTSDLELRGICAQDKLLGSVILELQDDFSYLDAKISDTVLPSSVRTEEMSMAGCRLMRKRNPFCSPTCGMEEACNFDGECVAYPKRLDVSEICVAGLAESYIMTAEAPGFHYFNTQLEHPAFAGGERIEVRSPGGSLGSIELAGVGVTKIKTDDSQWTVEDGKDLAVSWTTSANNSHSSIYITINVDQHGSSPLLLECELPDTGSASIPSALINELLTSGISGFPVGKIERRTADSIAVPGGCVEFLVRSPATVAVRVAGHTPCTRDDQCPSGQTCNLQQETCE